MVAQSKINSTIILERLFKSLQNRQFSQAENTLIALIEHTFQQAQHDVLGANDIHFIQSIYTNFNEQYLMWLEENHTDMEKEIDDLSSLEHDNFLIAQCADPAAVDDLMFELVGYLTDTHQDEQKQEVIYHLNCYKKILTA